MTTADALHNEAMTQLDEAYVARMGGNHSRYSELLEIAFDTERRAALLLEERTDSEPTRGLLFKGAATLAKQCGLIEEASRLADIGLAGVPPEWVADELREVRQSLGDSQSAFPRAPRPPKREPVAR